MIRNKKQLVPVEMPEFQASIEGMAADSRIFVDLSLEIAHHIFQLMEQKGMKQKDLADKLGKSEAEISKWLSGMHNYTLRSLAKLEAALGTSVICASKQAYIHVPMTANVVKGRIEQTEIAAPQPRRIDYTQGKLVHMKFDQKILEVKAI